MTDHAGPDLLSALQTVAIQAALLPSDAKADDPTVLVVAISGGLDSVCLAHALWQLAIPWGLQLHLAHLDHTLRPDSADDAAFVRALAASWGLPCTIRRLAAEHWAHTPGGLEAAARQARYAFLEETAINVTPPGKVPRVVVAHHAEDQAETILLHLARGSGLRGFAGMRMVSQLPVANSPVLLIRPLLGIPRTTLFAYAKVQGLSWREDSTNQRVDFVRNRLRHRVLPELRAINPRVAETLGRTATLLAADGERLAELDRHLLAQLRLDSPTTPERVILNLTEWRRLNLSEQRGVVREAVALLRPLLDDGELGFEQIERLRLAWHERSRAGGPHPITAGLAWTTISATASQPARVSLHLAEHLPFLPEHPHLDESWQHEIGRLALPMCCQLDLKNGWQLHIRLLSEASETDAWGTSAQPWQARFDRERVNQLVLTTPQPGWRIAPLGMKGRHKILGDLFTDCKVPVAFRSGWPVIVDQPTNTVLWVCGLAVAEPARLNAQTRHVLELRWQPTVQQQARALAE